MVSTAPAMDVNYEKILQFIQDFKTGGHILLINTGFQGRSRWYLRRAVA